MHCSIERHRPVYTSKGICAGDVYGMFDVFLSLPQGIRYDGQILRRFYTRWFATRVFCRLLAV